jgi:5'-3' exonuclease
VVHLIDAPVWVFRAWHALPEMTAPDGTPTNAAYGYANTLLKYLADSGAEFVAAAFDCGWQCFRNAIEPGYKAQRGLPPPELDVQFALCAEVTEALGVARFEVADFEADDLIATLAEALVGDGARVVVVTSDKDLAQLVREDGRVLLRDAARAATLDADGVRAKFGVDPAQIPDLLGLAGDAVDNLPGVPGVGAKGAAGALAAFASIERIPADPEAWREAAVRGGARIGRLVAAHRDRALRTRELATVRRDVPGLAAGIGQLRWRGADREAVEALFGRLGWGKIATRIPRWAD